MHACTPLSCNHINIGPSLKISPPPFSTYTHATLPHLAITILVAVPNHPIQSPLSNNASLNTYSSTATCIKYFWAWPNTHTHTYVKQSLNESLMQMSFTSVHAYQLEMFHSIWGNPLSQLALQEPDLATVHSVPCKRLFRNLAKRCTRWAGSNLVFEQHSSNGR